MKWLLIWVISNAAGADLPKSQVFDTHEQCEAAAEVLNKLAGGGVVKIAIEIRAACIEVPIQQGANQP